MARMYGGRLSMSVTREDVHVDGLRHHLPQFFEYDGIGHALKLPVVFTALAHLAIHPDRPAGVISGEINLVPQARHRSGEQSVDQDLNHHLGLSRIKAQRLVVIAGGHLLHEGRHRDFIH